MEYISRDCNASTNKQEFIEDIKWFSKLIVNVEIDEMTSENDVVIVSRYATLNDPQQLALKRYAFLIFQFKDNQIIRHRDAARSLNALLEYGAILMSENN